MSRRKRKNSRRRKSSSSSKQNISPYNVQKHTKTSVDTVAHGEEIAEKGEMDSHCKENFLSEYKDEKETESSREIKSRQGSNEDLSKDKKKKASVSEPTGRDSGLKIIYSVTVDDFGLSPKVVLEQCCETIRGNISCVITIMTNEFKCMKVEISEEVTSDNSDNKTTGMFQNKVKGGDIHFRSQNEMPQHHKNTTMYSWNHHGTDYQNICYKMSITEQSTELKDAIKKQMSWDSFSEHADCHNCCCKNNFCLGKTDDETDTDFTLVDGSSCCSSPSNSLQSQKQPSLPSSLSDEALWDTSHSDEFVDKSSVLDDLAEDVASGWISPSGNLINHNESKCTFTKSRKHAFMNPRVLTTHSSFTKYHSHNYERNTHLHSNSNGILEIKAHNLGYMDIPSKRRNTFPGVEYFLSQGQENIPSYRELFSYGTASSLFMQSLSTQAEKMCRFYIEDKRPFGFETCQCSKIPSSTDNMNFLAPECKAQSLFKNPFFLPRLFRDKQFHEQTNQDLMIPDAAIFMYGADQDERSTEPFEHNGVTENSFYKKQDEPNSKDETTDSQPTIHAIPSSSGNSEEHINKILSHKLKHNMWKNNDAKAPKKKTGSLMKLITGDYKQRFYHEKGIISIGEGILQEHQMDALCTANKLSAGLPIREMDLESVREADEKKQDFLQAQKDTSAAHFLSEENTESTLQVDICTQHSEEPLKLQLTKENNKKMTNMSTDKDSIQTNKTLNKTNVDIFRTAKQNKQNYTEWQRGTKNPLEVKDHLRLPADSIYKDSEDNLDHWARRRKLFKESKQHTSAGGSSITSNITEESDTINSEDTSVDVSVRDVEDRGFYTETFHTAPWIYRGDGVSQNESPCGLQRTRPAIRERTVKIRKGIGEYPWGFRIQYSKPIVVTEVDTNGAAEESGLQVGDYVLAVNGTDVTSIPHSEAADLARQGPDLLTLTIGSDIGQMPNTPRPACRGYLHKRTQSSLLKGWRKRWFVLRHDCCLYYYKNKRDEGKSQALSVVSLEGAIVDVDTSLGKPFVFKCCPVSRNRVYYFCATSNQEMKRWLEAMSTAVHPITQNHVWVDVTRHNSSLPPLAVKNPDCLGLLHQLDKNKDSWVQRYCVLKDACLYFYVSIRSTYAIGGIYLHGYTVKDQALGSKRSAIELRPPSEEFKAFYLCAENVNENKRWTCAIKCSIGKWLPLQQAIKDYMSRPPEETRM